MDTKSYETSNLLADYKASITNKDPNNNNAYHHNVEVKVLDVKKV